MLKKITASILLILLVFTALPAPAATAAIDYGFDLEGITANAIYLVNLDTGAVIYERDAHKQVHPASTTKIMSAALAMELCPDLETVITLPEGMWNEFEGLNVSSAGLLVGEQLTMNELIHCMLLQSANEAAVAVADYFGREEFLRKMNEKAAALGCTDTLFSNPHGAFVQDHHTSAYDMALITQWALTVPGFWEISQKARYDKRETNLNEPVTLVTTVLMQDPSSRYYTSYIKGIKTGTTDEAGRCLVSTAQLDGVTYLLVLLGASFDNSDLIWPDATSTFTETRRIYDWCFDNLRLDNVIDPTTIVDDIRLRYAAGRDVLLLYPDGDLYAILNQSDETVREVRFEYELPEYVTAPITAGDVVTTAKVYFGELYVGEVNLVSIETIERDNFVMVMDTVAEILTSTVAKIVYAIMFVFILIYLYYMLVVVPRVNKKRRAKKRRR
jgi:D-alanyl-D-alanine carboxypeptidase (penicillin-binding protein 5/6)